LNGINSSEAQDPTEVLMSSHLIKSSKLIQEHSPGLSAWLLNKAIDSNQIEVKKIVQSGEEEEGEKGKLSERCEGCGLGRLKPTWKGKEMKLLIVCDYCDDRNWKRIEPRQKEKERIEGSSRREEGRSIEESNSNQSQSQSQSEPMKIKKKKKKSELSEILKAHQDQSNRFTNPRFDLNQFLTQL
ncbi:hypothetical protein DFH28DRAFT_981186, partial [Melampsora americana]